MVKNVYIRLRRQRWQVGALKFILLHILVQVYGTNETKNFKYHWFYIFKHFLSISVHAKLIMSTHLKDEFKCSPILIIMSSNLKHWTLFYWKSQKIWITGCSDPTIFNVIRSERLFNNSKFGFTFGMIWV